VATGQRDDGKQKAESKKQKFKSREKAQRAQKLSVKAKSGKGTADHGLRDYGTTDHRRQVFEQKATKGTKTFTRIARIGTNLKGDRATDKRRGAEAAEARQGNEIEDSQRQSR